MDLEHIALQFGRVSAHEFTMDVQYPFSLLQAFGIALSRYLTTNAVLTRKLRVNKLNCIAV